MIELLVDEAYAFDYLAILDVKNTLHPSVKKNETYNECCNHLSSQVDNFDEIVSSQEYQELFEINKITFFLIDEMRCGNEITAKQIDDANIERFNKKKNLQNKFFINKLREEKILYK